MTTNSERSSHNCRVVIGSDAVLQLRATSSDVPIVALVDAASPTQAVLAQTAGADIVLPIVALETGAGGDARVDAGGETPGLGLAMRAATTIARRRTEGARSARRVGHDLAGALNVIGLAADVGRSGAIDRLDALQQIAVLVREANGHLDALGTSPNTSFQSDGPALGFATVDQAAAQADILEGVVRHAPLKESLDAIVAAIEHQLPDTACSVLLLRHGRTLHHGAAAKLPAAYCDAIDGVTIGLGQGSCGTAAFVGEPVVASDVTTDENWVDFRDVATAHGLRSCWSTPIVAEGGEVLGTFAVYKTKVWNPDRAATRLVERFTYLAAVAIEHHRLFGAEASNKAKTDFLALVSHELRTPLNAILGFAQVMQMVDLDAVQREDGVDQIVHAGEHLRDLIDDLLDLSRIEAGQLSVVAEAVESAVVIGEVVDLVRPLAASRDIALIEVVPTVAAPRIHADRRCVRQVLINLIANAVKYTPVGGRVRIGVDAIDDGMVRIGVTDSGPGISSDSIAELFQPFHRLERDGQASSEGTGLGLALSARLMDEMDGRIGVESTPGTGSCFWVEFPRAHSVSIPDPAPAVPLDVVPEPGSGVLLYIEDDPAAVAVLSSALALRRRIELRTAGTAAAGVASLQRSDIDVILLDIGLPDRSGWDVLRELRSTHPDVPVVVVTAGGDTVPAGFPSPDRLVTKPFDITDVLGAIDLVLAGSTGHDQISQAVDPFEEHRQVNRLRHETVEAAVGDVASHVG